MSELTDADASIVLDGRSNLAPEDWCGASLELAEAVVYCKKQQAHRGVHVADTSDLPLRGYLSWRTTPNP